MSLETPSKRFKDCVSRLNNARTESGAVVAYVAFDSRCLAEHVEARRCYRSTLERIDACDEAQAVIAHAMRMPD